VSGLPEWRAALETLRSLVVEYQDVISLPDVDRGIVALATLVERLEAQQEALTMIADYGHELDDYVLPPLRARKIARRALHPEEQKR